MNNNIKVVKKLVKIAKNLISALPDYEKYQDAYRQQIVDQKLLQELYDKYTDEISVDLLAGARQHLKTITIKSLKRWLKDNGYADWASGKKYDALYDYNKGKFSQANHEIVKEIGDTYIVSPQKLYQKIEEKINEEKSERVISGGLPSEQEYTKIYLRGTRL